MAKKDDDEFFNPLHALHDLVTGEVFSGVFEKKDEKKNEAKVVTPPTKDEPSALEQLAAFVTEKKRETAGEQGQPVKSKTAKKPKSKRVADDGDGADNGPGSELGSDED